MKTSGDNSGLGCLLFIGIGLMVIGGLWIIGPWSLLIGGLAVAVLAVLAAGS